MYCNGDIIFDIFCEHLPMPFRDGVYELRVRVGNLNYRALYFFAGRGIAVMAHGCTKETALDEADIDRAVTRRLAYKTAPLAHTAPQP